MALLRWAGPRSGPLARLARYPNPRALPWRRRSLDLVAHGGIGDVIMCTAVLRELRRRNPQCHVRFYSKFGALVRGLPYIDEALPYESRPAGAVYLDYSDEADFIAPRAPLISLLGDMLGLRITDTRVECVVDSALVEQYRTAWRDLPRPHIVAVRQSSSQRTSNKNWLNESWHALMPRLTRRATVIELGEQQASNGTPPEGTYVDLRGQTSLGEMVAAIAAADVYVGPMSGPAHIAAAVGTQGVVIYGGYEPPAYSADPSRIGLEVPVPCAPCWLSTPCPYDHRCLRAITPDMVETAIWSTWAKAGTAAA
jgi:ADP-heptose:LPS heptosyltransferase